MTAADRLREAADEIDRAWYIELRAGEVGGDLTEPVVSLLRVMHDRHARQSCYCTSSFGSDEACLVAVHLADAILNSWGVSGKGKRP